MIMEAAFDPTYGEAWNRRQVSDALTMPSTQAVVVDETGAIIAEGPDERVPAGFVMTRRAADEEELLLIAVTPENRERGIGSMLISTMIEKARESGVTRVFLEMREGNPAVNLYKRSGFEPIGRRSKYYRLVNGDRLDAITFGRTV